MSVNDDNNHRYRLRSIKKDPILRNHYPEYLRKSWRKRSNKLKWNEVRFRQNQPH